MRRLWPCLLLLAFGCAKSPPVDTAPAPAATNPAGVKLVVLLVFDQLRGDYLARWRDQYGEGGFKRLMTEGAWFSNCHYPYACTMTGPGHASLLTGCSPDRHGIIMNEWWDRTVNKEVYCSSEDRYELVWSVPRPPLDPKEKKRDTGGSPGRCLAPGFADALKAATNGQSKVVALSLKDRSACLPGSRKPDAAYFFDSRTGTFVTSTYYRDRCHDWVAAFNARKLPDQWFGKNWDRLRPDLDYDKLAGPDNFKHESKGISSKMDRVFPHPLGRDKVKNKEEYFAKPKPDKEFYDEVTCSPAGNELLLDFAKAAFEGMNLGNERSPDLLSISFSSNDLVGHAFGPDSHEVLDITLRTDVIIKNLLDYLDEKVGKGKYYLAMSADHGICPLPEISAAKGIDAKRLSPDPIKKQVQEYLDKKYPSASAKKETSKWIEHDAFPWVYLNYRKVAARGLNPADVAAVLGEWFKTQSYVATTYTRAQLEATSPAGDPYIERMKKAYHPQRSGDLALVWKPYYHSSTYETGTTHGSPHPYDTHVPLVFFGPGLPLGESTEPTTPQAIAAVLSHLVGVKPPAMLDATVPKRIMDRK